MPYNVEDFFMYVLICHSHIFLYGVSVQVALELGCLLFLFIKLREFLIYTKFKSLFRLVCYIFLSVCGLSINGGFANFKNIDEV